MSTSKQSSPEPDVVAPGRRGPPRPLIAVAISALVVIVAVAAVLPHVTTSGSSSPLKKCCAPRIAASQALSLSMYDYGGTSAQPDVVTLDPVVASGSYPTAEVQLVHLLFDGLVTLDDTNTIELWGADHVTVSSDGLTYTFHVRQTQSFSDGTPVEPSDYAWSIDRALNPCLAAGLRLGDLGFESQSELAIIKDGAAFVDESCAGDNATVDGEIKTLVGDSIIPDDSSKTLTITLQHPAGYFLAVLALPIASVLDRRTMNGLGTDEVWTATLTAGPTGGGGSGMFYLASHGGNGNLVLKPNPHWWGQSAGKRPNFTELDVHIYANSTLDYSSFLSSSYDYDDNPPLDSLDVSQSRPDYHIVPSLNVETLAFNWNVPPFNNADARQALCLAINRDNLAQRALQSAPVNHGLLPLLPSWHLVPQGMPGYNAQLTGIDGVSATSGDLAKAQEHWQAYRATLHGKAVPLVQFTYIPASKIMTTLANTVVAQWGAFSGLRVSAVVPTDVYLDASSPGPQAGLNSWFGDYPDPQYFLSYPYASYVGTFREGVSVPNADALLAAADAMSDPTQQGARMGVYQQAEQQLVQQVASCPLFQYQAGYLLRTNIVGMRQNGLRLFPNDDWVTGYRAA